MGVILGRSFFHVYFVAGLRMILLEEHVLAFRELGTPGSITETCLESPEGLPRPFPSPPTLGLSHF